MQRLRNLGSRAQGSVGGLKWEGNPSINAMSYHIKTHGSMEFRVLFAALLKVNDRLQG